MTGVGRAGVDGEGHGSIALFVGRFGWKEAVVHTMRWGEGVASAGDTAWVCGSLGQWMAVYALLACCLVGEVFTAIHHPGLPPPPAAL